MVTQPQQKCAYILWSSTPARVFNAIGKPVGADFQLHTPASNSWKL